MILQIKFFYRYFPFVVFLCCLGAELLLIPPIWRGYLLFVVFPGALLFWLVYWSKKRPEVKQGCYYWLVLFVFCEFALATLMPLIYNILNISEELRESITRKLSIGFLIFYILVVIWYFTIRHRKGKNTNP